MEVMDGPLAIERRDRQEPVFAACCRTWGKPPSTHFGTKHDSRKLRSWRRRWVSVHLTKLC